MKHKSSLFWIVIASVFYETVSAQNDYAQNCEDLSNSRAHTSGVYTIHPKFSHEPFLVYCNMDLWGGGWTYILNRFDGSVNFTHLWHDYKLGFGNIAGEFWLGLDHIHELTGYQLNELLVELVDWNNTVYHEHYKAFSVANEEQGYLLQMVGGYKGDLGDSLYYHASQKFSTADRDNDYYGGNCAVAWGGGGWWYNACYWSQLTGKYLTGDTAINGNQAGIAWKNGSSVGYSIYYSFKEARMMVRTRTNHKITV